MQLDAIQQREVARKAVWLLDIGMGRNTNDTVVLTGEGVPELDRAIELIQGPSVQPGARFLIDIGSQYSDWRPFDVEDLQAIRAYYIGFYGDVDRPNVWDKDATKAIANEP